MQSLEGDIVSMLYKQLLYYKDKIHFWKYQTMNEFIWQKQLEIGFSLTWFNSTNHRICPDIVKYIQKYNSEKKRLKISKNGGITMDLLHKLSDSDN